jgi:nucleoid-associated protein EbfC
MAGVGKLLKQAQKMQKKMEALREELATRDIEVSSGGGAVTVKITLAQEFKSLHIDPEFFQEGRESVEEAVLEAVREAIKQSREKSDAEMETVTQGMSMPGLM